MLLQSQLSTEFHYAVTFFVTQRFLLEKGDFNFHEPLLNIVGLVISTAFEQEENVAQ